MSVSWKDGRGIYLRRQAWRLEMEKQIAVQTEKKPQIILYGIDYFPKIHIHREHLFDLHLHRKNRNPR